jgi:hypothetical protein
VTLDKQRPQHVTTHVTHHALLSPLTTPLVTGIPLAAAVFIYLLAVCLHAVPPRDKLSKESYMSDSHKATTINHFYEKLLKIKVSQQNK